MNHLSSPEVFARAPLHPVLMRRFWALCVLAAVVLAATMVHHHFASRAEQNDAAMINKAGRQRMLSQRIVALSLAVTGDAISPSRIDELETALNHWTRAHEDLSGPEGWGRRDLLRDTELREWLETIKPPRLAMLGAARNVVQGCRSGAFPQADQLKQDIAVLLECERSYLLGMDAIANRLTELATERIDHQQTLYSLMTSAVIVFLIGGGWLLLRPLELRLRQEAEEAGRLAAVGADRLRLKEQLTEEAELVGRTGYWQFDVAERRIQWSRGMFHLFGTPDEILAPGFEEHQKQIHPEDLPEWLATVSKGMMDGEPYQMEFRTVHPDGTIRHVLGRGQGQLDAAGAVIRLFGTCQDITELKQAQAIAARQEGLLNAFFEKAPVGMGLLDHNLVYSRINSNLAAMNGLRPEAHIGRSVREVLGDVADSVEPTLREVVEKGVAFINQEVSAPLPTNLNETGTWRVSYFPIQIGDSDENTVAIVVVDVTEAKQTEEQLRRREALVRDIGNSLPDTMIYQLLAEADGGRSFLSVSDGVKDIHGISVEEALADPTVLYRQIHPEDAEAFLRAESEALQALKPFVITTRFITADGRTIWSNIRSCPRLLPGGDVLWNGVEADVTAQKAQEQLAMDREAFLKSIGDNLPDTMVYQVVTTAEGGFRYTYASQGSRLIHGLEPEDIVRDASLIERTTHPDDLPRLAELERRVRHEGGDFFIEVRRIRRDGTTIWTRLRARPRHVQKGVIIWDGTEINITEQRAVEERLRLLEQAVVHASNAVLITEYGHGKDGIIYANPAFERISGYKLEDIRGRNPRFLQGPERDQAQRQVLREALAQGGSAHTTLRNYTASNTPYWVEIWINPIRDAKGEITHYVGIQSDISPRVETQLALEQAKSEAEHGARAKAAFLANMSHELRTPMNAVIGMTGLLLETSLSAQQRDFAGTIRRAGENLLQIINEILDYSKIEEGHMQLESITFGLERSMAEVMDLVAFRAQEKGIELGILMDPHVPLRVEGDPSRLRQILLNLASNAVKFTDQGSITLGVSLVETTGEKGRLRFEIRDTGAGIPEDRQQALFQPFVQADVSTTRRYGGTGLGLAISRELVQRMGGTIGLTSRLGSGSTFWFELPFGFPSGEQGGTTSLTSLHDVTVLVVDDHPEALRILRGQLTSHVRNLLTAATADEALEVLSGRAAAGAPIQAAVLDLHMPRKGGGELARAIRANPLLARMTLVLLSGSMGERANPADLACFNATLMKPASPTQLVRAIAFALGRITARERVDGFKAPAGSQAIPLPVDARILLVEDNPVNQKLALLVLQRLGLNRLDTAMTGYEAVEATRHVEYDLVLMDCQMPDMDGFQATRLIRQREVATGHHMPIVAMTAYALEGDRARCLEAGMDAYLTKPINMDRLVEVLHRYLTLPEQENQPMKPKRMDEPMEPIQSFFDLDRLAQITGGSIPVEADLMRLFVTETRQLVRQLEGETDLTARLRLVHAIKGAAANMGATLLAKRSAELEKMLKAGAATTDGSAPRLSAVLEETILVLSSMNRWPINNWATM